MDDSQQSESTPVWLRHPAVAWRAGTLDREALHAHAAALRAEPGFAAVRRAFAAATLNAIGSHWALNKLMRNTARYAFVAFVLDLEHRRRQGDPEGGITAARLLARFARAGMDERSGPLSGSTRIKAMLALARVAGDLVALPAHAQDKRLRLLRPTDRLMAPLRIWLRSFLAAVAPIRPLPAGALEADDALIQEVMSYNVSALLLDGFALFERFALIRECFSREAGYVVLHQLLLTLAPTAGGGALASASYAPLGQRFRVARGTVRNLVRDWERQGHLAADRGGGQIRLAPPFRALCEQWVALELTWMHGLVASAYARRAAAGGERAVECQSDPDTRSDAAGSARHTAAAPAQHRLARE